MTCRLRSVYCTKLFALFLIWMAAFPVLAADWPEIPRGQLTMKGHPLAPGADAVILRLEVFTDYGQQITRVASDVQPFESHYVRIKVLSEEGKKYADVSIPYVDDEFLTLADVEARTVQPDGRVVEFTGPVFDKVLYRRRGLRWLAKTFTLPEVQVGSILEYRYKFKWHRTFLPSIRWILQGDLFTEKASFSVRPLKRPNIPRFNLFWTTVGLPEGTTPKAGKDGILRMELENIPALKKESFMPPKDELKMRVHFFYSERNLETPEAFWKREDKEWNKLAEEFMDKGGAVKRAVQETVESSDAPEVKLRKLYARVQQIRNLSYEPSLTPAEAKRQSIKPNDHVEDVLSRNYGQSTDLARLFVALARAAKFDASIVRVSSRDEFFFNRNLLDWRQLNDEVAVVRLGDQTIYLDPGTRFCPFGMLAWEKSGVQGIRLEKNGGEFVTTPVPRSADSVIERRADLRLLEDGTLEGHLQVSFTGQHALGWRLKVRDGDPLDAEKQMKEEIESWLPPGASVTIGRSGSWQSADEPLRVEAEIRVANFVSAIGRRWLVPSGLFHSRDPHPFSHQARVYPVYFEFPFQEQDTITVSLPGNYTAEAMPAPSHLDLKAVQYTTEFDSGNQKLVLKRHMLVEGFMFRQESYGALRAFYDRVRASDAAQVVLQVAQAAQKQ